MKASEMEKMLTQTAIFSSCYLIKTKARQTTIVINSIAVLC